MTVRRLRAAAALLALALLGGCAPRADVFDRDADIPGLGERLVAQANAPDADPEALERLAWLRLLHPGRVDEAAPLLVRALRAGRDGWRIRLGLALAEELLLRPDAAAAHWAALLGDAPTELRRLAAWRLRAIAADGDAPTEAGVAALAALDARPLGAPALGADLRAALHGAGGAPAGSLREWRVWPRIEPLARLGFARGRVGPPASRGTSTTADAQGVLRFHSTETGLFVAEATATLPTATTAEIVLDTPLAARVFVDDEETLVRDTLRVFAPERLSVRRRLAAGDHVVRVEAAVDVAAEGVRVRILPDDGGDPTLGRFEPAALSLLARAWRLHEAGQPLAAAAALAEAREGGPEGAALAWFEARAARSDPTIPPGMRLEREMNALRRAVERDPSLAAAHGRLAELLVDEGRSEEALRHVAAGEAASPESGRWDRLRYQVFLDRGWEPEARTALARALRRRPDDCQLAKLRLDLDWESLRLRPWEPQPAALSACPSLRRAHASWLGQSGEPLEAAQAWRAIAETPAGTFADRHSLAVALLAAERWDEGLAALEALVAERPEDLELRLRLGEAYRMAGRADEATAERATIEARPEGDPDVRRRMLYLTDDPFFVDFVVDGPAWVAESHDGAETLGRDADAVILLDQQVTRFYGDGRATQYAHALIHLRTQRGAETFGEVQVAEGVEVVVARTIKADGSIEEPEERPEKSTLSMPSLEPGDTIDYAYLRHAPARAYARPDVLSDPFYFQSYQAPILRSEWTVAAPPDLPLVVEARGDMAPPVTRRIDGLRTWTWRRTGSEQMPPEPDIPDARATLPYVRVGSVTWETLAARIADDILTLLRAGPLGDEIAATIAARTDDPDARARAAFEAVRERVGEETDRFFETPAAHTFAEGRGERLFALAALLARLDVAADVVLVKPVNRVEDDGPVPDALAYSYPVLRVRLPGGAERWLDPALGPVPYDYLAPVVQGRPGLLASPDGAGAPVTTPTWPLDDELRTVSLDVSVLPGGGALTGEGREEFLGIQAVTLRNALLETTDDDRIRVVTTLLRANVPRARLTELAIDDLEDPEKPLVFRYRFTAELAAPTVPGPPQRVPFGLLPESYSAAWAQLAVRRHPLFFNVAIRQRLDLSVTLPESAALVRVPQGHELVTTFGTHETRVWAERDDDGRERLRVRKDLSVPLAIVPPSEYATFVWACRSFDRGDRIALDLRWRR